jgi:integrase/recombinase XerD
MTYTLADCYEQFLDEAAHLRQLRPATVRAYRYELRQAAADPRFQKPLAELTLSDLESWIARDQVAPSTLARRAATFSRCLDWAVRHGYCATNPLRARGPIRAQRHLPRPIPRQTDRDVLDSAVAAAPQPYRLVFTLLRETGMRVSEALDLRVGDVTLEAGHEALRVREGKGGFERVVILGATATPKSLRGLRAHLKALRAANEYELLFRSRRGTRLSYDAVHYQWAKVCAAAELVDEAGKPRYTLHQLRHTRGSELVAQGQPMEIIQRVLGHRDIRSTLGYAELSEAQVRAALEQGHRR